MKGKAITLILILFAIITGVVIWRQEIKGNEIKSIPVQPVSADSTDLQWYKNSIIYTLDVEVFKDSDHDGIGDFKGLTSRLGYIDSLGADAIWLAPFQPTPNLDDGYDVSEYTKVDERLGTLEDFQAFLQEAKKHRIKVLMDLVVNHTSDKHPWFTNARSNKNSPYRQWYVWSKDRPDNYNVGMVFPGVQKTIWTYDSVAGAYYYHRFYSFQPDLNTQHAPVQAEIKRIIKFWLDRGIDGFRLDGVPFFIEVPQKKGEKFEHQYEMLADMRRYVTSIKEDAVILGEANVLPDENKNFFGEKGEGMQMMFNFFVNQHLFYALASGEAEPLRNALERTQEIPEEAEWGQFLRNHDEVDLGRLSKKEREKVYAEFGPEKNMQLYDRGIRRRLAPMMNNNRKHLELAYSLLFSLPSTPVMRYGDEIGMGDDLRLKERLSVRTPMQWNAGKHGGFTNSDQPVRPVISSGPFSYQVTNVEKQKAATNSLLHWTIKMAKLRKQHPEIAFGEWSTVDTGSDHVLAILYQWNSRKLLVIHNLSEAPQSILMRLRKMETEDLIDVLDGSTLKPQHNQYVLTVEGYGYKWLGTSTKL